jgi:SAM-dependent methyltransferase
VSQSDADKWNQRYREGAYATRTHPSAFVEQWLPRLQIYSDQPRAVDIGCGAGRNALHLARHGWQVDAVDVSSVALNQLTVKARAEGLSVSCIQADLEHTDDVARVFDAAERYDLALIVRYTELTLIERIRSALRPGGYLMVELHLQTDHDVIGPRNAQFRVAPGELLSAAANLDVVDFAEGLVTEPDGRTAALARLVARR